MAALTDSLNSISFDPKARPGVSNLLGILSIFDSRGRDPGQIAEDLTNRPLLDLKQLVADAVIVGLHGIRQRYIDFLSADGGKYLDWVEAEGARKARENAEETMALVRQATGL